MDRGLLKRGNASWVGKGGGDEGEEKSGNHVGAHSGAHESRLRYDRGNATRARARRNVGLVKSSRRYIIVISNRARRFYWTFIGDRAFEELRKRGERETERGLV